MTKEHLSPTPSTDAQLNPQRCQSSAGTPTSLPGLADRGAGPGDPDVLRRSRWDAASPASRSRASNIDRRVYEAGDAQRADIDSYRRDQG